MPLTPKNTPADSVNLPRTHREIRLLLGVFIFGLVMSGATAFPLVFEVNLLARLAGSGTWLATVWPALAGWIDLVQRGLNDTSRTYPFMFYGTDWLAFAHLVIALAFIGPLRDPVKNVWVVEFGMLACGLVIPLALICGPLRGIPFDWMLVDCSFGVFGIMPLLLAYRRIRKLIRAAPLG